MRLPNVERWARQVASLLRRGGRFYIHDSHPLAWALADDSLAVEHTYFEEHEPFVSESPLTYTDSHRDLVAQRSYEWNHSIGEIVTSLIRNGLRIEWLSEHDWTVLQRFSWLTETSEGRWTTPPGHPRLPLSFSLMATRVE